MKGLRSSLLALLTTLLPTASLLTASLLGQTPPPSPPRFPNGLPTDPAWFPLAVWLQAPANATRYRELGINLYVGLWNGPTAEQLTELERVGMPVICHQNDVGRAHAGKAIVGWMHNDEPDNAQARRRDGYAPPIAPAKVVADYEAVRKLDPTRPVLLNLGQGAAWDGWHGRGERSGHAEDYPEYLKGCDLGCFDIYPVTHPHHDVAGKLGFVGRGVQRLRRWTRDQKPVWACIETGHVANATVRPTPEQVRTEVWMAIACGASGIVYFCHEFAPQFAEAGLLAHADIVAAVTAIDAEVLAAAKVLNSPRCDERLAVAATDGNGKPVADAIAVRAHEVDGVLHLFTASLHEGPLRAAFTVHGADDAAGGAPGGASGAVEVVGAATTLPRRGGTFTDTFAAHGIRHYRLRR